MKNQTYFTKMVYETIDKLMPKVLENRRQYLLLKDLIKKSRKK